MSDPSGKLRDVWNVMKSPSSDTDPKIYTNSLAHNVEYHQAVGYEGTLAIVTFPDVLVLLANPKARAEHCSGRHRPVLVVWKA